MLPSFATQEITRIRPGTKTLRGSEVPDWSPESVSELKISGCSVQPATTSLSQDGRVLGINEQWTAFLPEGSDVRAGDRIMFDGDVYEINGAPKRWMGAFTRSNIQLNLTKAVTISCSRPLTRSARRLTGITPAEGTASRQTLRSEAMAAAVGSASFQQPINRRAPHNLKTRHSRGHSHEYFKTH